MAKRSYTLTLTAEKDLRAAKAWSLGQWGKEQTKRYFAKLHQGAEYAAKNHQSIASRQALTGESGLSLYPVGAHYLVYTPIADDHIVIVAVLRQEQDLPTILARCNFFIQRELQEIREKLAKGKIKLPRK